MLAGMASFRTDAGSTDVTQQLVLPEADSSASPQQCDTSDSEPHSEADSSQHHSDAVASQQRGEADGDQQQHADTDSQADSSHQQRDAIGSDQQPVGMLSEELGLGSLEQYPERAYAQPQPEDFDSWRLFDGIEQFPERPYIQAASLQACEPCSQAVQADEPPSAQFTDSAKSGSRNK